MADLPTTDASAATEGPDALETTHRCGRCRKVFDMEPTHVAGTIQEMWLCASCRVALLGRPTPVTRPPS